jgi:hypothetical protein
MWQIKSIDCTLFYYERSQKELSVTTISLLNLMGSFTDTGLLLLRTKIAALEFSMVDKDLSQRRPELKQALESMALSLNEIQNSIMDPEMSGPFAVVER